AHARGAAALGALGVRAGALRGDHALHARAGAVAEGSAVLVARGSGRLRRVRRRAVAAHVVGALVVVDRHVGVVVRGRGAARAVADALLAVARGLRRRRRTGAGEAEAARVG